MVPSAFVCLCGLVFLRALQSILGGDQGLGLGLQKILDTGDIAGGEGKEGRGDAWMLACVEKKGRVPCRVMDRIVVCKFCRREKEVPVRLLLVDECAQHDSEGLVHDFCLAVGLWVIGGREGELDIHESVEFLPEATSEFGIAVGDNRCRHPVQAKNIIKKLTSDIAGCGGGGAGDEVSLLRQLVDKDGNGVVVARGLWKMDHEVHCDNLPAIGGDGEGLQQSCWSLLARLVALALLA